MTSLKLLDNLENILEMTFHEKRSRDPQGQFEGQVIRSGQVRSIVQVTKIHTNLVAELESLLNSLSNIANLVKIDPVGP